MLAVTACTVPNSGGVTECLAPANAGGGWDLTCRSVGRALADLDLVSGTVQVTNMPGAGGGIGFVHTVTQRDADRNLLVAASPSTTLNIALGLYGDLNERDVRWIGAVGAEYGALAVRTDAPWSTLSDMLDDWRRDPEAIIAGGGSAMAGQDHMKVMLLARAAGIEPRAVRYVPFDGGGEAMTTMLGGFIHVFSGELSEILPHLEAGNARVIALMAPERLGGIARDVPTVREEGYDVTWVTWRGFYIPGSVADSTYARWVDAVRTVAESDVWARERARYRLEPFAMFGDAFETFVAEQVASFRTISRDIGLQ